MNPTLKSVLWTATVLAAIGSVAMPKVLPLLHAEPRDKPAAAADSKAPRGQGNGKDKDKEKKPLEVATYLVTPQRFAETINATGTLRAEESVELQAEIAGKVVQFNFREGAAVREGDLLVKLNDADLQASMERAVHRRQLAELREKRLLQLLKQGVARQEEYDIALSELDIQRAEVSLIQAQIQKTEIRAPFAGIVGLRYVSEGAFVNAATRVATLQRLEKLKVDFSVPEKYAARIRPGIPVRFTVAGGERSFAGEIYASDPRIDTATRSVLIRAVCPNRTGKLLPGAFVHVELTLSELDDALLIPTLAVMPGLAAKNVFLVKDGKAVQQVVQTGTRLDSTVHILSGLHPGDVVITSGLQQLREGQPVVIHGKGKGEGKRT